MTRLSVVIFGATGFTGKHAALEMARQVQKRPELTWGVAGRSQSKLEDLMRDIAKSTGEDQSRVKIIIAEVNDEESLKQMCSQAQVVANCCGPYRLHGEPVLRAALRARAHYVDVSGEPQFMETMQLKYDAEAREGRVCAVSACGFDCVPNDMGVVFLQDHFGGTLNSVESYMSVEAAAQRGSIHVGTWDSLVLSLAHWDELKPLRQKLYPDSLPPFTPKLLSRGVLHSRAGRACVPFPGADGSVVYRTQRRLHAEAARRPAHFRAYLALPGRLHAVVLILAAALLALMAKFSFTRRLLLQHPGIFSAGLVSREGPRDEDMRRTGFRVELCGRGWSEGADVSRAPNKEVVARVSGTNPGYGATVVALIYCAIALLEERDRIPAEGGVLTTGVAFKDTSLIKNLNENGIKFEILETAAV